jgi:hypothetical protein
MRTCVALAIVLSGCAYSSYKDRPARFNVGVTTRQIATPTTGDANQVAFRTRPSSTPPTSETADTETHKAIMGSAQFTMQTAWHTYLGGEVEAGVLDTTGSSAAGMYGVGGIESPLGFGKIGAELAAGYRTMRYSTQSEDIGKYLVEPRLKAELWISDQFTFGATLGGTLEDHPVWMAGIYLGVHSHAFDVYDIRR